MPDRALELLLTAIENSNDDIVIGAFRKWITLDLSKILRPHLRYGNNSEAVLRSMLKREINFSMCGKIFRRYLFDSSELPLLENQINGEDAMLLSYLVHKSISISYIPSVVYDYMYNPSSATRNVYSDSQIMQIIRSGSYLVSICSNYPGLEQIQNKSSIRGVVSLLFKHKCRFSLIKSMYDLLERSYVFSFKYLFKYYSLMAFPIYIAMIAKKTLESNKKIS